MTSSSDHRLFDIHAAAQYLQNIGATGVTPWTIRRLLNSGDVPCLKIGKRFYLSKAALDSWLLKNERRR
jgi:excisionase family DNA binding protein